MEVQWFSQPWHEWIQDAGIIAGLIFTAISLWIDVRARRVANLLTITSHHRELWTCLYERPELQRIWATEVDFEREPIKGEEELFVKLVVLHLSSAQAAIRNGMFRAPQKLRADIRAFFSRPIPKAVWAKIKATSTRLRASSIAASRIFGRFSLNTRRATSRMSASVISCTGRF